MVCLSFSSPPSSPLPSVNLPRIRMAPSNISIVSDDDVFMSDSQLPPSSVSFASSPAPSSCVSTLRLSRPGPEGITEEDWNTFPWIESFPEHVRSDEERNAWWWKYGFKLKDCRSGTKPRARSRFICVLCYRRLKGRSYDISRLNFDASGAGSIRGHLVGRHNIKASMFSLFINRSLTVRYQDPSRVHHKHLILCILFYPASIKLSSYHRGPVIDDCNFG